ncbi:hypothetical protein EN41_13865 [Agrobacterium tumefaciens]|uniref:phage tail protein n=1 Tax=Agrobacterium fabrum TaxID=1176649 RepID=UPI0004D4A662|nr:phage tail protein [Agrobacterium fabrum]KEY54872.1 hypothetical protein EN41_13865 [Agrobacterium tumefaciens]MCX2877392.1 phage tail protein [Agrobacterium fabrum]NMV68851.1 tail fiber protein [Agrobacterium fabrum]QQN10926.1 tail fiber protein [Agrobacterium fabrum]WEN00860.1 phage tail protein [Agrobacterium fabrum]
MADIHARLVAREELEASFESLMAQGIQASLEYIQVNVAPQLVILQNSIALAQEQIDQIIIGGKAPDALKLGGQLPGYYVPKTRKVNGKELSDDVTLEKADIGLADADNTSDKNKPVSDAQKLALDARIKWLVVGDALPTENIGPIWHDAYKSVMTWQSFAANGAAYTGYASLDVGKPTHDAVLRPGFLKLNGASFQKTAYVALWNWARHNGLVVDSGTWSSGPFVFHDNGDGTFRVPDLRGEFFRSADDGRGVDSARTVGSWQAHMTASHSHGVNDPSHNHTVNDPSHAHGGVQNGQSSTGRSTQVDQPPAVYSFGSTWGAKTGIWLSSSVTGITIQAAGGIETRPRNTAFLACIKF